MSLKKTSFLIFISFFPVFIFRSNFNFYEIIFSCLIFIIPFLLLNYLIIRKKVLNNNILRFYLSVIIIFGIDNNLGLWNGIIQPLRYSLIDIFGIIYVPALIFLIILFSLMYFILLIGKEKFYNVIIVFLFTIFIFNIFDPTKSYKKITNFINESEKIYKKTKLVIVFDAMSGMSSLESSNYNGAEFNTFAENFFKKHNFEYYSNVNSISANSVSSLSALLNFSLTTNLRTKVTKISPNYFYEYELFFEKFNDISIFQNIHIDYCNIANISKCETHNPFKQKKFLNGFKDTFLTKIVSIWKLNGSISSTFIWRLLRELRIIDSVVEPEGHKTAFGDLFNKIEKDIYSENYDLIFVHTLVPHRPYGFDNKCNYDGSLSTLNRYFSTEKHIVQHNIERKCVLVYLDKFLENLKNNNKINNIDLTILSDHGARITKNDDSSLSTIYAIKNTETKFKEFKEKNIMHKLFSEQFN